MITHRFSPTLFILAALIGSSSVGAAGIDNKGNYDDGSFVWSPISNQSKSYPEAVDFCLKKTQTDTDGRKWELPTEEQLKGFYQRVAMKSLPSNRDLRGWNFGDTWTSTEAGSGKHETANLGNGLDDWNGRINTERRLVTCVAGIGHSYYDGENTWLKISPDAKDKKNFDDAKKYCANYDKGSEPNRTWALPSVNQLQQFYAKIVKNRKDALIKGGWALGDTWSSEEMFIYTGTGSFTNYSLVNLSNGNRFNTADRGKTQSLYVTCVR